jgi:hypothetical protein
MYPFLFSSQVHVKVVHLKLRPFKCGHCDYSGGQKTHLDKHMETCHGGDCVNGEGVSPKKDAYAVDNDWQPKTAKKKKKKVSETSEKASKVLDSLELKKKQIVESATAAISSSSKGESGKLKKKLSGTAASSSSSNSNSISNSSKSEVKLKSCPICDYTSPKACNVRSHVLVIHHRIKPFICDCHYYGGKEGEGCGFAGTNKSKLVFHLKKKHGLSAPQAKARVAKQKFDLNVPIGEEENQSLELEYNIVLNCFILDLETLAPKAKDSSAAGPDVAAPPSTTSSKGVKPKKKKSGQIMVTSTDLPDPSQNPRKLMALGANVSGLGAPASAGRMGAKRKRRSEEEKKNDIYKPEDKVKKIAEEEEMKSHSCDKCDYRLVLS